MPLRAKFFTLGQMQNNTIVLFDVESKMGLIIDPSFQTEPILDFINQNSLLISSILCTHAHFDHFAGVPYLLESLTPRPIVAIGAKDLEPWQDGGGSKFFQFNMRLPEDPDRLLQPADILTIGDTPIEIREVPGHSPGSLLFYIPSLSMAFCGDALFRENIGRTDLKWGNHEQLIRSIKTQILTLPDHTVLIPGHGSSTTVAHEKHFNPFLVDD